MALSVVQSIGKAAGSGNCNFTLGSSPTVGNGLLALVFYNDAQTITAPSGSDWVLLYRTPLINGAGAKLDAWWHIVKSGDGTGWTFPVSGDYTSGQLYEITGADNQFPLSGVARGGSSTGTASIVSASATPAVANSLAFAAETDNNGTSISSVTSGWTLLQDTGTFHGGGSAYNSTLTSSAASCTFTMSGTSAGYSDITILIAPAPGSAPALYPLQNTVAPNGTGNIVLTLSDTPAPGNLLLAFCAWNNTQTNTAPSGWTNIFSIHNSANDALGAWYRVVQSGDGASYTFTLSGDYGSGELYEVTGASTTSPVNGYATATDSSSLTSRTTPSVVPNVLGCLPFAVEGSDGSADQLASVSSGWGPVISRLPTYHGSSSAYQCSLTTDTSTGITCTFTYTAAAGNGVDATVLIAPSGAAPPPASRLLMASFP